MKRIAPLLLISSLLASPAFAKDPEIFVKYVIGNKKEATAFPDIIAKPNAPYKVSMVREIRAVTEWDPPSKGTTPDGIPLVAPATPTRFITMESGWTIEGHAEPAEGGLIKVTGVATYSEPGSVNGLHGEHSGPIYTKGKKKELLTPNKTMTMVTHSSQTPFQVFAHPGKPYAFKVNRLGKTTELQVTCDFKKS